MGVRVPPFAFQWDERVSVIRPILIFRGSFFSPVFLCESKTYEEAIEFYCGKLGFIVAEDTQLNIKRWMRLKAPGRKGSEILLSRAVDGKQRACIGNQTGGRVLFFLHTDNFDADYARFRLAGIDFAEGPLEAEYGKVAVFKDLYGNRIDLIEPRAH